MLAFEEMQRAVLYLKVEVDLDPPDTPEKVASELCRQLQKFPTVRRAELSSHVDD
jgi:hypothetical protein